MANHAHTTFAPRRYRESTLPYRFDRVDPLVMFDLAQIISQGADEHSLWNCRLKFTLSIAFNPDPKSLMEPHDAKAS